MEMAKWTNYDPEKRMKEIKSKLEAELNTVTIKIRQEFETSSAKQDGGGDSTSVYVEDMKQKAEELGQEVDNFQGEHFTRVYRTLFDKAEKYQMKLDEIDVIGREDIRLARKKVLDMLNDITEKLNKKTHTDGKPCPACELQKI